MLHLTALFQARQLARAHHWSVRRNAEGWKKSNGVHEERRV